MTSPTRQKRSTLETGSEIVAALMWGPKTRKQLRDQVGLDEEAITRWLRNLQASGVVYVRLCGITCGNDHDRAR